MEYNDFSCHVFGKGEESRRKGKLCQGERATVAWHEWHLKADKGEPSMTVWGYTQVEGTGSFPTKAAGVCSPFFGAQSR